MTSEMTAEAESEQAETEIERLALLQEVDQRLHGVRAASDQLEQEIRERAERVAAMRERVRAVTETRDTLDARRRELEQQLDDESAKMKDRRMRLNRVHSERELQAVRREIELGKEATQQMEAELLACMEQLETEVAALEVAERELQESEPVAEQEIGVRREKLAALEQDAVRDASLRENLATKINRPVRDRYEQIFARRGGVAVVEVRNGTCLGCYMHVPPQLFNEIQKTRDVRVCPNCHRMLFWRPETAAPDPASTP